MKFFMSLRNFVFWGSTTLFFVACSDTTSSMVEDELLNFDNDIASSSSRISEDGGSAAGEEKDCIGESGKTWDGTTAKEFACGTGTKLNPYIIKTAEQLAHLSFVIGAKDKDYLEKYYKLGADIILNDGEIINEKGGLAADSTKLHKWTPIGNSSVAFAGSFDGDGHTVSGMFINTTSTHNGLFGHSSGTVQNLTVENGWVMGGKYTAGVVGMNDKGLLKNLTNKGSVVGVGEFTGGIVGSCQSTTSGKETIISHSYNYGVITGKNSTGGIAGQAYYAQIDTVANYGSVDGATNVGGVVGKVGYSLLSSYYISAKKMENYGDIVGTKYTGGVVGLCGTSSCSSSDYVLKCGTVNDAGNYGKITGKDFTGGLMGYVCKGPVKGVVNEGDVEGTSYVAGLFGESAYATTSSLVNRGDVVGVSRVGGISGYNAEGITSSAYSTGKVDGDSLVGLMIGYNYNTTMADYYYLKQGEQEPFGKNDGGGVATQKTEKEMRSEDFANLLGDNFIYNSEINNGYPILKWELEE